MTSLLDPSVGFTFPAVPIDHIHLLAKAISNSLEDAKAK